MGNIHALAHRATALSQACLSSVALILAAVSAMGCSFLAVKPQPYQNLMTPSGYEVLDLDEAYMGLKCKTEFYDDEDRMWGLSNLFFYISIGCGSLCTALAWALSICIPPNEMNWRALSILSAITAVLEVPIFLLFETLPCRMDANRQTCGLAIGSYFLIVSIVLWVAVTLWTQGLEPPRWDKELNAWVTSKNTGIDLFSSSEEGDDTHVTTPEYHPQEQGGDQHENCQANNHALATMNIPDRDKEILKVMSATSTLSDDDDLEADVRGHRSNSPSDRAIRKGAAMVKETLSISSYPTEAKKEDKMVRPHTKKKKTIPIHHHNRTAVQQLRESGSLIESCEGEENALGQVKQTQKQKQHQQPKKKRLKRKQKKKQKVPQEEQQLPEQHDQRHHQRRQQQRQHRHQRSQQRANDQSIYEVTETDDKNKHPECSIFMSDGNNGLENTVTLAKNMTECLTAVANDTENLLNLQTTKSTDTAEFYDRDPEPMFDDIDGSLCEAAPPVSNVQLKKIRSGTSTMASSVSSITMPIVLGEGRIKKNDKNNEKDGSNKKKIKKSNDNKKGPTRGRRTEAASSAIDLSQEMDLWKAD